MDSTSSELFCWSMAVFFFPCPPGQPAPKKVLQLFIDRWWAAFIGRGRKGRRGAGPGSDQAGMGRGESGTQQVEGVWRGKATRGRGRRRGRGRGEGGLQAKATVSVRGRVYGVYAQNGITSCGVGLMSGSVSGGRAADRRDGGGRYVCEYYHAPRNVVTLHSFQDRWACVCSAAVPECLRSEYANAFRGPLIM